ncbi:elongation factor G [Tissierella creatinophila]|uniref:Elongation factor G n=1 Tax=Tissierella creatinophila DSM 6911 TaxID=1123403 RepID=A0A1U7M4E0_TISCR|nr:elongation factor G [Tissierella creatinophila]OLS02184.1 elongation factor G [Tissierella creatinophila DSM 6911]
MKIYQAQDIRNVALVGHSGSGKTTLTEAMLFTAGITKRQGKVEDGNTISDFGKEEIDRGISIGTSLIPVEWNDTKINVLDTPGYFDFVGETYGALRASEGAILVVDASSGIEVGTEKAWKLLEDNKRPRFIFLNKMDKENVDFDKLIDELKEKFGDKVFPFALPIAVGEDEEFTGFVNVRDEIAYEYVGKERKEIPLRENEIEAIKDIRESMMEKVAETDEILMEKFFAGEAFSTEEIAKGVRDSMANGELVPVFLGSAEKGIGIDYLLSVIKRYIFSPMDVETYMGKDKDGELIERKVNTSEPFSAIVFKTIVDPFVGKLSLFQVSSGRLTKDTEVYNENKQTSEKLGGLFILRGKEQIEVNEILAGDIGATSKLHKTQTGDSLCDKNNTTRYRPLKYPKPTLFMAVEPKSKGDEEKIGTSLHRLTEEDPTFSLERNKDTKQLLIGGQGNMQLSVIKDKLKNTFGVDIILSTPKIPYKETIKTSSDVQGKHKKQSGGAGQYGDVHIKFEPCDEEFIFEEEVFGGSVPRNFFPAVERGIRDSLDKGVLAGYPVVNIKATLYDGSYHPVDSNEMAFKIAASMAFKKGIEQAKPILLEPIMKLDVNIPEDYMGDIMGDLNKRRGRVLGMEPQEDGTQLVIGEAPQSEVLEYAIDLRSMTQARGNFSMEFARYEEVPSNIAEKLIETLKNE